MSQVFYTSDTHFGHSRCAVEFRRFDSSEQHDALIIQNWNRVVGPNDIVYHLGDVTGGSFRGLSEIQRLNGRKILIAGNHDAAHPMHRDWHKHIDRYYDAGFEHVTPFMRRKVEGRNFLMMHLPFKDMGDHTEDERYPEYRLTYSGLPALVGHVHDAWRSKHHVMFNVGVDVNDWKPVPESTVVDWLHLHEQGEKTLTALDRVPPHPVRLPGRTTSR